MVGRPGILWFVLDEASVAKLRQIAPPLYANEFYHHVTLRYGVSKGEVAQYIGKEWRIKVTAIAHNSEVQACRVQTDGLPDEYGVPHITLSTAPGIKPFASVAMLQGAHDERRLEQPVELSGRVQFEYLDQI